MPAVLIEISFISHNTEESYLKKPEFKEKYAQSLFDSIVSYKQKYEKKANNGNTKEKWRKQSK